MSDPELDEWREAERLAQAAEALVPSTGPLTDPRRRILAARAKRLRKAADERFARVMLSQAARERDAEQATSMPFMGEQSEELGNWIAAWRRAEARARAAEEKVISAYTRYVAGDGALPPLTWESDVAMLRLEANRRIERIYSAARRIRKPTAADFRESVPAAMGGRVDMDEEP